MFWGEAQLQSMIDKGRTPLPVFGREDEPTAALTANAFCMIDSDDPEAVKAGFGMGCALLIPFFKIVVTGLSLGTGIIGGTYRYNRWAFSFTIARQHDPTTFCLPLRRPLLGAVVLWLRRKPLAS